MIQRHETFLRTLHVLLDAALLGVTFLLVHRLVDLGRVAWLGAEPLLPLSAYSGVLAGAVVGWVTVLRIGGAYHSYRTFTIREIFWLLVRSGIAVVALVALLLFAWKDHRVSRALLFTFIPVSVGVLLVERVAVKKILEFVRRRDHDLRFVLVVGGGAAARELIHSLHSNRGLGIKVVGRLVGADAELGRADRHAGALGDEDEVAVLGDFDALEQVLKTRPVDEVGFFLDALSLARLSGWLELCAREGVRARLFFMPPGIGHVESYIDEVNGIPSVAFGMSPSRDWQLAVKRGIDIVVSLVGLVVTSPLLGLAALAVRLSSPGPVLFRQERFGLNKRKFRLLKLRTMVDGAEQQQAALSSLNEMDGPVFKMRNDPRVTPIGRLLRATSIDEIPQLVNVLVGHMSLVGPRPPIPSEVDAYEPWQRRRLSMKPGITGPWQVNGRNELDFERWMTLDMEYVDDWHLGRDLAILAKTIPAVMRGSGAW